MTNETKTWLESLKSDGGLSEEAFNALKASVESNTKADEHIKGSVLRQSDYSRQSADIQKAKTAAEDALKSVAEKELALTKFQGELGTWKTQAEGSFKKALADREAAELKANAALNRLNTVAEKYGLPAEEITIAGVELTKEKTVETNQPKYTTEADLQRIVGGGMREAGILDAMIYDLGSEHQALFGTPLPKAAELVKEALAAGKPLTEYWAEKYKVGDRRTQLSEEQYQSRLKGDVEAEVAKRLSAANLPGVQAGNMRPDLPNSPIFQKPLILPTEEGGGISAAIAAFNVGKHRVK